MTRIPQHLIRALPADQRGPFEATNRQLAALKRSANCRGDWAEYLEIHDKGDRINAFIKICHLIEPSEYWPLLRFVWVEGEFFDQRDLWTTALSAHPEHRQAMMLPNEAEALDLLPKTIDVYRGAGTRDDLLSGFSWTLDRERAVWFSARFVGSQRLVARGRIKQKKVIALIEERGEREIVGLPPDIDVDAVETISVAETEASPTTSPTTTSSGAPMILAPSPSPPGS